jgi:hypothetical protein
VVKKPAGLSADLKAGGDFLNNADARQDLRSRGFAAIPARNGGEGQEIISNEGEVLCTLINGVEYVLRFGDLRMATGDESTKKDPEAAADKAKAGAKDKSVQRYMFAMARFDEDAVKKPELAELPALPEGVDEKAVDAASKAEETKDAKPADDGSKADAKSGDDASKADAKSYEKADKKSEKAGETASADAGKSDAKTDAKTDAKSSEADAKASDEKSEEVKKIIAERKRIETENQRKLDDYQQKLEKGRETVKNLNLRFGDWYFVVSNDVFNKIRLSSDDVIKKKDKKDDKAGDKKESSAAGSPGQSIPGLPSIPGVGG